MHIRKATHEDKAALAALHAASIRALCAGHYPASALDAWTALLAPAVYDDALAHKVFLVAEEGGALLGLGMLDAQAAAVSAVYVAPDAVGLGVGAALLAVLERAAAKGGLARLTASATLNARGFYARRGYEYVRDAVHALPDGTELPCVEMVKELPA
jgi:putative acetyltransferase